MKTDNNLGDVVGIRVMKSGGQNSRRNGCTPGASRRVRQDNQPVVFGWEPRKAGAGSALASH